MSHISLRTKIYLFFGFLALVSIGSMFVVIKSLEVAASDADIVNALGRQRMLTQAMGKTALGYASRIEFKILRNQVSLLDRYITHMRKIYAASVIKAAKQVDLDISMDPAGEQHPAVPFPATLTRMVNEEFGAATDKKGMTIDIIAQNPVNPDKGYTEPSDSDADAFLSKNPKDIYWAPIPIDEKLYIDFYTADIATVEICASCHSAMQGVDRKVGDMLGIRRFRIKFAENVALGEAALNPDMKEYTRARTIFEKTLSAMKSGGEYPADLKMTRSKQTIGIDDPDVQAKILEVEAVLGQFLKTVDTFASSFIGAGYLEARSNVLIESNKLRQLSNDLVGIYTTIANRNQQRILWSVILSAIITLALLVSIVLYLTRGILRPIDNVIDRLGMGADQITSASGEVSSASQILAEGAISQANTLQAAVEAVDLVATQSTENVSNATKASSLSANTLGKAEEGRQVMEEMVTAMEAIKKSSDQISNIIKVIEEIAFQTNLLALNAAVEAARAGEHGKGFAVVAEEVRNLAQRAASAARDTAKLISDAVNKASSGSDLAIRAGDSLDEIVGMVNEVTDLVDVISSASADQADGVGSVRGSVAGIDNVTQQNAATAEESAAASEELFKQAEELQKITQDLIGLVHGSDER